MRSMARRSISSSAIRISGAGAWLMGSLFESRCARREDQAPGGVSIRVARIRAQAGHDNGRGFIDTHIVRLIELHVEVAIAWIDLGFEAGDKSILSAVLPCDPYLFARHALPELISHNHTNLGRLFAPRAFRRAI